MNIDRVMNINDMHIAAGCWEHLHTTQASDSWRLGSVVEGQATWSGISVYGQHTASRQVTRLNTL